MFFYIDNNHLFHKTVSEIVSNIIYNTEFIQLKNELEVLYKKLGSEKPDKQAFNDALYSYLSQEEGIRPLNAL